MQEIQKMILDKLRNCYIPLLDQEDNDLISGYIIASIDYIDCYGERQHPKLTAAEKDRLFAHLVLENPTIDIPLAPRTQ